MKVMSDPVLPGPSDPTPEAASHLPYAPPTQTQLAQMQPAPAPPHPYAVPQAPAASGRGIAITAMALGLTAVFTVLMAVFYLPVVLVLGAGLGVAALVLGGIAVARRGPRAPGVTGLVSGSLALLLTVGMVAMGVSSLGVQALMGVASHSGAVGAQDGRPGDPDVPGAPHENVADVEWPANLATGGIMFTGGEGDSLRVIETEQLPANSFPDVSELVGDDGTSPDRIQLYLDYRCPACLTFEQANGDTLERAAQSGAVVELQPLTFLDGASAGNFYSSRVSGAMACLAENQPEIAWEAHRALLSPEFQPVGGIPGPDNVALVERIEGAAGPLNDEARSCISEEQHVVFAQALSNWISTNPVPRAEIPDLRVEGTPLTLVNGVAYAGDISDPAAFSKFLAQQGVPLKER